MVCRSLASFIPPTASAPPLPFSFILGLLLSFPTEGGRGIHDTPEVGLFLAGHLVNLGPFPTSSSRGLHSIKAGGGLLLSGEQT